MRLRPFAFAALLLFAFPLLPQQGFSQQAAQPPTAQGPSTGSDPQALAVLTSARAALAGPSGATPASLIITGTYTRMPGSPNQSPAETIRIETLGAASFRSDLNSSGGTVTNIINGSSGWTETSSGGRALAAGETFGRGIELVPVLAVSRWLSTQGVAATYVAAETLGGAPVNHVSITPPSLAPAGAPDQANFEQMAKCEVYLDSRTNLPLRIRVYHRPTDRRASLLWDIEFANYQTTGGMPFPYLITYSIGGQPFAQLQIQSIAVNASIPASDFTWSEQ